MAGTRKWQMLCEQNMCDYVWWNGWDVAKQATVEVAARQQIRKRT
nr:hypothetical protein Itr_chr15CG13410 [Ipomoea trifida]